MTAEVFAVDVKQHSTFSLSKKLTRNAKVGAAAALVLQNVDADSQLSTVLDLFSDVTWGVGLVGANQIGKAKSVLN
jgi:hypothetical protein